MRDHDTITAVVHRLGWLADTRQWNELATIFTDRVRLDYTALTGEPATLAPTDIVAGWKAGLGGLDGTQHLIAGVVITVDADTAQATAQFQATHVLDNPHGDRHWVLGAPCGQLRAFHVPYRLIVRATSRDRSDAPVCGRMSLWSRAQWSPSSGVPRTTVSRSHRVNGSTDPVSASSRLAGQSMITISEERAAPSAVIASETAIMHLCVQRFESRGSSGVRHRSPGAWQVAHRGLSDLRVTASVR